MFQTPYRVKTGVVLTILFAVGVSIVMAVVPIWQPSHQLALRWEAELDILNDLEVHRQLEKIAQLGRPGIEILIHSLSHRRRSVATASRTILSEQFSQWRLQPTQQATPRLEHLARQLAHQSADLNEQERRWAVDLAMQMLVWPADMPASAKIQLVQNCETILHAAGSHQTASANLIVEAHRKDRQSTTNPTQSATDHEIAFDELPEIPGGDLPLEIANIPSALPPSEIRPRSTRQKKPYWTDSPSDLKFSRDKPVNHHLQEPAPLDPPFANRLPRGGQEQPTTSHLPMSGQRLNWGPLNNGSPSSHDQEFPNLQLIAERELIHWLHSDSSSQRQAAQEELVNRGFNNKELQLAKLLGASNPQQRIRLTRMLPSVPIDTERWWTWLCEDIDPQVRIAAITVLATTSDPELQKRLRRMQLEENSELVLQQIQQILERRR